MSMYDLVDGIKMSRLHNPDSFDVSFRLHTFGTSTQGRDVIKGHCLRIDRGDENNVIQKFFELIGFEWN